MSMNAQNGLSGKTLDIECVKDKNSAALHWKCCDLKQFCAKVNELNEMQAEGELRRDATDYEARRALGDEAAADYRAAWNGSVAPAIRGQGSLPSGVRDQFYHPCAERRAANNNPPYHIGPEMQVDHVHEVQLGGSPDDFGNLRWLSASVNGSIGSSLKQHDPQQNPGGISADCCPAENRGTCSDPANDENNAF